MKRYLLSVSLCLSTSSLKDCSVRQLGFKCHSHYSSKNKVGFPIEGDLIKRIIFAYCQHLISFPVFMFIEVSLL